MIDLVTLKTFPSMNLKEYVRDTGTKLMVFSPFVSFLQGLEDMNSELAVRNALQVVQDAIEGTDCGVLGICHLNKKADLDAVEKLLGSVAFANYVRSVMLVKCENRETAQHRLVHAKHNWSIKGSDLLYTPECIGEPRSQDVRVIWSMPESNVEADNLYDRTKKPEKKSAVAGSISEVPRRRPSRSGYRRSRGGWVQS